MFIAYLRQLLPSAKRIADAAADIYRAGIHGVDLGLRISLVSVGRDHSGTS
jgi:hypothetical protein